MRKLALIGLLMWPLPLAAQDTAEEPGFVEKFLEDALSGAGRVVDIKGFSGALSSTARIDSLTIADGDGVWLTLNGVILNWSRSALLSGRLEVAELSATELLLPRRPLPSTALPSAEASPFALPDLPVSVNIGKLAIARAELGTELLGQEAVLSLSGSAALAEGAGQTDLAINRLSPQDGTFSVIGSYSNETRELLLDLSLDEPENGLAASLLGLPGQPALAMTLAGQGPIDNFTAQLALTSDGQERLSGQVTIASEEVGTEPGSDTRTTFAANLGGDIAPLFAPDYQPFFGPNMTVRLVGARASSGELYLDDIVIASDALNLSGRVALDAAGWPQVALVRADLAPKTGTSVLLPLSGPRTLLQSAQLTLTYDAIQGDQWRIAGNISGLQRSDISLKQAQLDAGGTLRRADSTLAIPGRIMGTLQASILEVLPTNPDLAQALGPNLRGQFAFDWASGKPFEIKGLALTGEGFEALGDARIATIPATADLQIDTTATLRALDLSRFAGLAGQPVAGAVDLKISGRLFPVSGAFDLILQGNTRSLSLQQPMLDPLLDGPGQLHLSAKRDLQGTTLRQLDIRTNHALVTGSGAASTSATSAKISAKVFELQRILPDLSGEGTLTADLSRDGLDWTLSAAGTGPGNLSAQVDGTGTGRDWTDLDIRGTAAARIETLSSYAALLGRPVAGTINLRVDGSGKPARQSFDGAVDLSGSSLQSGLPQLDQILQGQVTLSMVGARDDAGILSLSKGQIKTPELQASATSADGKTLEFKANLRDLALLAPGLSGAASTKGTATLEASNWRILAEASGPGGTSVTAAGTVALDASTMDMTLQGTAPLNLANNLIRPQTVSGDATYGFRVFGAPSLAAITGGISARDVRFAMPKQALALEGIDVDIAVTEGVAQVSAQGRVSSGGTINISGPVALTAPFDANLQAVMTDVRMTDPKLFETSISGPLQFQGPLSGGAQISGRLTLGETELRVPNPSGTSYANLPGLRHVNEPANTYQTRVNAGLVITEDTTSGNGPDYGLDLQIIANDRIFVRGRGLDAELGGLLRLQGSTRNVVPQGRFDLIRGRLDILGKRLTLDEGLISLQGAFDPYLRFVASTETSDITANIVIEGQASSPALSFTSSPEMPQDEVLALILFGKEISSISPLQAVRLAAAVSTLTGRGGELGESLRKGLAVDDLDVTTSEEGATEARVGKYLSENIYSEVTADTEGKTQINLNLNINRSITARGRLSSDGDTGLGLFIEKDY